MLTDFLISYGFGDRLPNDAKIPEFEYFYFSSNFNAAFGFFGFFFF
jgi:hypothetical protein